jgi:hypothetical protein
MKVEKQIVMLIFLVTASLPGIVRGESCISWGINRASGMSVKTYTCIEFKDKHVLAGKAKCNGPSDPETAHFQRLWMDEECPRSGKYGNKLLGFCIRTESKRFIYSGVPRKLDMKAQDGTYEKQCTRAGGMWEHATAAQ